MASISSPGIGSGLDVNQIVGDLIKAEQEPFDKRFEADQLEITEKISSFGALKSTLSELDDVLFNLKLPTTFSRRSVETTSSNFTVEAGSAALPASYEVQVNQVAKNQSLMMGPIDTSSPIGSGSMTIASEGLNKAFTITVESGDTLEDIAAEINNASTNFGVVASIISGDDGNYLAVSVPESKAEGLDSVLSIVTEDDDGLNFDDSGLSQLAYAYSISELDNVAFATSELAGEGSIRVNNGTDTVDLVISATDTIEDVVDAINAAGINVTAALQDNGAGGNKLTFLSANDYGNHKVSIEILTDIDGDISDASGISRLAMTEGKTNYDEIEEAQSAQITVNGSVVVTSDSNTFEDAIDGVVLTVTDAHSAGQSDDFTVSLDKDSVKEELTKFLDSFNAVVAKVDELSSVDIELGTKGLLTGDSTLRTMMNQIRSSLASAVTLSDGTSMSMSSIGFSTAKDGTLTLDDEKLTEAIDNNFEDFKELFSSTEGVGKKLATVVNEYKTTGGIIDTRLNGLETASKNLDEEKATFMERLGAKEDRLYAQFLAMDLIVANLNSTSQFLESQLANLPGSTKKD